VEGRTGTFKLEVADSSDTFVKCFTCSALKIEEVGVSETFMTSYLFHPKDGNNVYLRNMSNYLNYTSLKMETADSFEIFVPIYHTRRGAGIAQSV
jgi:hypothetical protein